MLTSKDIVSIFKEKINRGRLEKCVYLKDLDAYWLDIDYDPDITDPHAKKTSNHMTCIDGKTKEIVYIELEKYFDNNEEVEIALDIPKAS